MTSVLASIPSPDVNTIPIGPLDVHFYGIAIALGAMAAVLIGRRRYAALGGDPDLMDRLGFWVVMVGILGGRLAYVSTHLSRFEGRPWAALFIWEGGLAIFGALTVGFGFGYWFAQRIGIMMPAGLDAAVPGVPFAQALGRWGNYFNQELYGTPSTLPWAVEIDPARRVAGYEQFATFHPTFLYESILNLVLFGVLLWLGTKRNLREGSLFFAYLIGYGLIRFSVELLRTDTEFRIFGLSRNNWVAALVCVGGAIAFRWWQGRRPFIPVGTRIDDPVRQDPADVDATSE
jgi:prolipoprotein diacylglyceryl transferase